MGKESTKQIRETFAQLRGLIAEEEGWEPKTTRDFAILTWAAIKRLEDIPIRVTKLESNQGILAGIQATFTIIAATLAGYFGMRR